MKFRYQDTVNGCVGAIDVPTVTGKVTVAARGMSRAEALSKAARMAQRIAADPVVRELMPPDVMQALNTLRELADAAQRGPTHLRALASEMDSDGARRVAKSLAEGEGKEVGWLPVAIMAAKYGRKYGPEALKRIRAMRKRKRKNPGRTRERAEAPEPEAPEPEAEAPEAEAPEAEAIDDGDSE